MAPMLKRRKILDGARSINQSITAFAKVSKATTHLISVKEIDSDSDGERKHKPVSKAPVKSKKRAREIEPEDVLRAQPADTERGVQNQDVKTTPRKKVRFTSTQEEESTRQLLQTPTKGSRSLLESFAISSPPRKADSSINEEIQDLIDLNTAFLNALAIHYAHNGTASPVALEALIPRIEKKWGKRRITTEDIQRSLEILHLESKTALSLAERNHSRICIEYDSSIPGPLPVETLKKAFLRAVKSSPVRDLPLEPIQIHTVHANPFLSKGALRLQDLKATALAAQPQPHSQTPHPSSPAEVGQTAPQRASSLLSRILQKETLASTTTSASPESLARKAALQRLDEIIPILSVLTSSSSSATSLSSGRNLYTSSRSTSLSSSMSAAGSVDSLGLGMGLGLGPTQPAKVVSFTMANLVQHLQNSMRHPPAREEAERAIRVLADEVAPKWVTVRDVGTVVGVTFRGRLGRGEWVGRVRELLSAA